MGRMVRGLLAGAAAGAAGTTALNAVTYLDMALRGRPSSSTPQDTVEKLADRAGMPIPGSGEERDNRLSGLGPLLGLATGVAVGATAGVVRSWGLRLGRPGGAAAVGAAAMLLADAPMAALSVSDPRTWSAADWISDAVPHLAYGLVTSTVLRALESGG